MGSFNYVSISPPTEQHGACYRILLTTAVGSSAGSKGLIFCEKLVTELGLTLFVTMPNIRRLIDELGRSDDGDAVILDQCSI
jgi:hypothetical protein